MTKRRTKLEIARDKELAEKKTYLEQLDQAAPAEQVIETVQPIAINIDQLLADFMGLTYLAIDIETNTKWHDIGPKKEYGLSYVAETTTIAFAWRKSGHRNTETGIETAVITSPDGTFPEEIRALLIEWFLMSRPTIAHNAVFDFRGLSKLTKGLTPESVWDTLVMERLLNPGPNKAYGLLAVADGYEISVPDIQRQMKAKRKDLAGIPAEQLAEYAGLDAKTALLIYERQLDLISNQETSELVDWECRANAEYCRIAARGCKLNIPYVHEYLTALTTKREELGAQLASDGLANPTKRLDTLQYIHITKGIPLPECDSTISVNPRFTPAGRARIKYIMDMLGTPTVELTDLSLSKDALQIIINGYAFSDDSGESLEAEDSEWSVENPDSHNAKLLADLIAWKQSNYLITVLTALLDHAALDGRIHSLVSIATTAGRRNSGHPQVQNWNMEVMRGVATGDDDYTLFEIDYSNAENWLAALVAGDSVLAAACASADFHSTMAEAYFGSHWTNASPEERKRLRSMGKSITFGTAYGMGQKKLAVSLGITEIEAARILNAKDQTFQAVSRAKEYAKNKAIERGYISLWTKRIVPVDAQKSYRSWNYLCQGGVAEIVKRAIVLISEKYRELGMNSYVTFDMHDAIIIAVHHEEWSSALNIAQNIMQTIVPEKLNNRTNPPIQWIAKPKPEENAKKWGMFQKHFELENYLTPEAEQKAAELTEADSSQLEPPVKFITTDVEVTPQSQPYLTRQSFKLRFDDMQWEHEVTFDKQATITGPKGMITHVTAQSLTAYYESMLARIGEILNESRKTRLPVKDSETGEISLSDPVMVDLVNYAKVPYHWLAVADQCDLKSLTRLSLEQMQEQAVDRTKYLTVLKERFDRATEWLAVLKEVS